MSKCHRCGVIFIGIIDYCAECQAFLDRVSVLDYDERQVESYSVVAGRIVHGDLPAPERRWWINVRPGQ